MPFSCCDEPIANDEQSMVVTAGKLLNQNVVGFASVNGEIIGLHDFFFGVQFDGDTALMICATRFNNDGKADLLSGSPSVFGAAHRTPMGHWNTHLPQ